VDSDRFGWIEKVFVITSGQYHGVTGGARSRINIDFPAPSLLHISL
jgi:hypothetical protein